MCSRIIGDYIIEDRVSVARRATPSPALPRTLRVQGRELQLLPPLAEEGWDGG